MAKRKGLLHFTVRRTLQTAAAGRFAKRDAEPAPSETTFGKKPSTSVVEFLRRSRTKLAAYRRISRNAGRRLVDRTQRRQNALDLRDTRLMVSSWQAKLVDTSDTGLVADVQLRNQAPYASFAHPKGTSTKRTFVGHDLPPIVHEVSEELAEDQAKFIAGIASAIAADAVRSAFIDATLRGR